MRGSAATSGPLNQVKFCSALGLPGYYSLLGKNVSVCISKSG